MCRFSCRRPDINLSLVICNGIGMEPLMLITNLESDDKRLPVTITKVYLLRWRIEEFYRFKKQKFNFEDLRVRSLNSIRNLNLLTSIVVGFIASMSEKGEHSRIVFDIIALSKRIFGVAKFNLYAIADGILFILSKAKNGISDLLRKKPKSMQLSLFHDSGFQCVG